MVAIGARIEDVAAELSGEIGKTWNYVSNIVKIHLISNSEFMKSGIYHGFHLSTCTNEPVGEDLCARCEAVFEKE